MIFPKGKRQLKAYKTQADSFEDFKRIWAKSYKVFPTQAMAEKWTGKDKAKIWLQHVKNSYYAD